MSAQDAICQEISGFYLGMPQKRGEQVQEPWDLAPP